MSVVDAISLSFVRDLDVALSECAEFYSRRAPTERGVRVWARKLRHLPIAAVTEAIDNHMAAGKAMPTPEEILVKAQEIHARVLRERDERLRALPGGPARALTAEQKALLRQLVDRLRSPPPRPRGELEWAHRLRERELAGEELHPVQRENWRAALRVRGAVA